MFPKWRTARTPGNARAFVVVDGDDACVGVGAAQHLRVQQPAELDVVGEHRLSPDEPRRIDLALRLADHGPRDRLGRGDEERNGGRRPWHHAPFADARGQARHEQRLARRRLVSTQPRRRAPHGGHDLCVAALAIEDARERISDLGLGRVRVAIEQGLGGEDHRAGRIAGLQRARLDERRLNRVQLGARVERLDGCHPVTVRLGGEHDLRRDQVAVDQDRGGARLSGLGAEAGAEAAFTAQDREERLAGSALDRARSTVEDQRDVHLAPASARRQRISASARR